MFKLEIYLVTVDFQKISEHAAVSNSFWI